ncbi:hypothetical protein EG328_002573 [Venturia inaequalis]|uniref:Uncharacterized protein n=1 Tax=Venturia inaequalis TaxID=5025 RepID=A0A8H3Z476_VENIN|nr:hypothetical protein EG328_002573 [Venturia inaequalis]KAE9984759.1 hypothetical protein EG327_004896 [Venturia inaequalis]
MPTVTTIFLPPSFIQDQPWLVSCCLTLATVGFAALLAAYLGRETSAGVLQPLLMDVKPGPNAERAEEDVQEAVIPKVFIA